MNHSASTSIFHATHTRSELVPASYCQLDCWLLRYNMAERRERERGAFGTTSSYASVGRGTTRAVFDNTIPKQCPVSCNYIYTICKPIQSRTSVVQNIWRYARLSAMKRGDIPVRKKIENRYKLCNGGVRRWWWQKQRATLHYVLNVETRICHHN